MHAFMVLIWDMSRIQGIIQLVSYIYGYTLLYGDSDMLLIFVHSFVLLSLFLTVNHNQHFYNTIALDITVTKIINDWNKYI